MHFGRGYYCAGFTLGGRHLYYQAELFLFVKTLLDPVLLALLRLGVLVLVVLLERSLDLKPDSTPCSCALIDLLQTLQECLIVNWLATHCSFASLLQ